MKQSISWCLVFLFLFGIPLSFAKAPKLDIVLIHGFGNFFDDGGDFSNGFSEFYWSYWKSKAFKGLNVRELKWDSKKRIEDELGSVVQQFKGFLEEGHCQDGCLIFTHSTGGLIADVLLSRSLESKGTNNDFSIIQEKTIAAIEIASAAGGVSFADHAMEWVEKSCQKYPGKLEKFDSISSLIQLRFKKFVSSQESVSEVDLGTLMRMFFTHIKCENLQATAGAVIDLRPNVARDINGSENTRVMTLMVAGNGDLFGGILKPFLIGESDGLVAMHSACGGSKVEAVESCVVNVNASGKKGEFKAPTSFYANHYPFIMTEESHDTQLVNLIPLRKEVLVGTNEINDRFLHRRGIGFLLRKKLKFASTHLASIFGKYFNYAIDAE